MIHHKEDEYSIVEHLVGVLHYHIRKGDYGDALCGANGMVQTPLGLKYWGEVSSGLDMTYCSKCKEIYDAR